jgi:hypothetical protein
MQKIIILNLEEDLGILRGVEKAERRKVGPKIYPGNKMNLHPP